MNIAASIQTTQRTVSSMRTLAIRHDTIRLIASGGVKEIRGQGLMLGIDLAQPCGALTQRAADNGLLISVTADSVVRLLPPLIMTIAEADEVVQILCPLIEKFLAATP